MNKYDLLETLQTRHARWDALLAMVSEERMIQPSAADQWSVKDIVSHVTAYERWLVEWLTAASQNTFPPPSPLDDADVERRNARVFELTRTMSLVDVMNDSRQTFAELIEIINSVPDEYFDHPGSAEWFMKPYWSKMNNVPDAVINLSADHYDEHIPSIKTWIENQPKE
jgi:hypothetical protein